MITGKVNYNSILKVFVIAAWASCISLFVVSCGNTTTPPTTVVVNEDTKEDKTVIAPKKDSAENKETIRNVEVTKDKKNKTLVVKADDDEESIDDVGGVVSAENVTNADLEREIKNNEAKMKQIEDLKKTGDKQ